MPSSIIPAVTFVARLVVGLLSIGLILFTLRASIRTLVMPRAARDPSTAFTFNMTRRVFLLMLGRETTYQRRDQIMAYYGPVALLLLLPVWLCFVLTAYAGLFWATGIHDVYQAFVLSGSSLLTLGFASDNTLLHMSLAFSEATIGLILVALLIAYLPTIYAAFSTREAAVRLLDVRAGTPPTVAEMLIRAHRIGKLHALGPFWNDWEMLFSQIEESHTSLPVLVFFRSPVPEQSWVTAAGNVMDSAAFVRSTVDAPVEPNADLCIRAGYLALRRICDFFDIAYPHQPHFPDHPISITRDEYESVCQELADAGVPLKPDREQTWRDFAGWRVNYDHVLLELCAITMAPLAPWSSDRAPAFTLPPLFHKKRVQPENRVDR